jgi:hypothetical protein
MALNLKPKITAQSDSGEEQAPSSAPAKRGLVTRPSKGAAKPSSGFVQASGPTIHRLIVSAEGQEKSGKNHFSFTAPEPIFMHSFDIGNEGVVQKFQAQKRIMIAEYELTVQPGEAEPREVAEAADVVWEQFMANYRDGLASCGSGTTVIDTSSEAWELLRLSRFGKLTQVLPHHYGPVNKEMQGMVREGFSHNCNVIHLHKQKPVWENYIGTDGKEKGRKTGEMGRVGFSDMPFLVQLNVECRRTDLDGGGSDFEIFIGDCRQNPSLNNTVLPNDFETLLTMVFED